MNAKKRGHKEVLREEIEKKRKSNVDKRGSRRRMGLAE